MQAPNLGQKDERRLDRHRPLRHTHNVTQRLRQTLLEIAPSALEFPVYVHVYVEALMSARLSNRS